MQIDERLRRFLDQFVVRIEQLEGNGHGGVGKDVHRRCSRLWMRKGYSPARSGRKRLCRGGDPRIVQARTAAAGDTLAIDAQRNDFPSRAARRPHAARVPGPPLAQGSAARAAGNAGLRGVVLARAAVRVGGARRRRVAHRRSSGIAIHRCPRPVSPDGFPRAADARLDAAGTRRQPAQRRRRRAASPILVPALRPPRRPDGELRRAGRRRGTAFRFLRRIPVAGIRAAPLALRTPGRSRASARPARQDPAPL